MFEGIFEEARGTSRKFEILWGEARLTAVSLAKATFTNFVPFLLFGAQNPDQRARASTVACVRELVGL